MDDESWAVLIEGLVEATKVNKLQWGTGSVGAAGAGMHGLRRSALRAVWGSRVWHARSESAVYELSSDTLGRAPFELSVWTMEGDAMTPLASVESSLAQAEPEKQRVNRALDRLGQTISASASKSAQVVEKLLKDFE